MDAWKKDHGWKSIHDWEFPMLPKRFAEAACLKCHHQVEDLVGQDQQEGFPSQFGQGRKRAWILTRAG